MSLPVIYFIFPYRGVGGVPNLFVRVGEYLSEHKLATVRFVDYEDGAMAGQMNEKLGELVPYRDTERLIIPEGAWVVFQSMTPWSIFPKIEIEGNSKIFFWNCHPFNLVPTLPGFRVRMQSSLGVGKFVLNTLLRMWLVKIRAFVKYLESSSAIAFMDQNNLAVTESYLDLRIEKPAFLPVAVDTDLQDYVRPVRTAKVLRSRLNVMWVGRIVDFKLPILILALQELNRYCTQTSTSITFTLVGEGSHADELASRLAEFPALDIVSIANMSMVQLDEYLRAEVDLLLAMGTAALDGAKLGVPTILLDMSYGEVPKTYRFRWLHQRTGHTLADVIDGRHLSAGSDTIDMRLDELFDDPELQSRLAVEYVEACHSLKHTARELLSLCENSTCSWAGLEERGFLSRGFLYGAFSVLRKVLKFSPAS